MHGVVSLLDAMTLSEAVRLLGERILAWDVTTDDFAVLRPPERSHTSAWLRYTLEG